MKPRQVLSRLRRDRRGAQALEFAVIAAVFFPVSFAILELGLLLWTQNAMQSAAAMAARCGAIGSADCADVADYAAKAVGEWVVPDQIDKSEVTVNKAGSCNGAPGTATIVTIAHQFWSGITLPAPFNSPLITVTACFPSSAS